MSHFRTGDEPGSEGEAIQTLERRKLTESAKTATATLTVDEFIDGICTVTSASAVTLTTPTAAAIVAELPGAVIGTTFDFIVVNDGSSSGAVAMSAGTGVTLSPSSQSVAITKNRAFKGVITNVNTPAVKLIGLAALA
jgi:hypothetical protein